MPTHSQSPRARALGALAPIALLLVTGCAGGAAPETSPPPERFAVDTSTPLHTEGRSMETLFAGRFPGVTVRRADGGGLQILIRGGANSFYGSSEPLYLVDDMAVSPVGRGILFLNPNDIQKIEVLKNPEDVGVYGMRGANGVVKITLKKAGPH